MSIDDALPEEWDEAYKNAESLLAKPLPEEWDLINKDTATYKSRYYDNRSPKEVPYAPEPDPVNSPAHYTHGGDIECIDAIDAMLGRDGSFRYYEGTMLKYLWRWRYKGGVESLRKLRFFVDRLIEREVQGG
jgi:hypothetical protein